MFNHSTYANSITTSGAFMEVIQHRDPDHVDERSIEQAPQFMPLKSTRLTGSISGPIARLTLEHRFGYPENSEGPVLEAVYRFPLPGDAAVTGVIVTFGETTIRTELADRREAESEYDEARRTGHQAILLTQETADVFTMYVSGITPGEVITVHTSVVLRLIPAGNGFEFRLPLTPAPRYISDAAIDGRQEHGQPLALALDPGHRFSLDLTVDGEAGITSASHDIVTSSEGEQTAVSLRDREVVPDRDLLLRVEIPSEDERPALHIYRERHAASGHDYLLSLVTPPVIQDADQTTPREIILLVDRSGSMYGAKWDAADWAVRRFLSSLREDDMFSLGLFHSDTRWFSRVSVPASRSNVEAAGEFVEAHTDSGGTELELALEEALTCGRAEGTYARHIVIITDAQVANARDNLRLVRSESQRADRRRISMLCIDAAPNSWLVHEMTAAGGGQAQFLTSDPDEGDIATALDEIMSFWDRPVETGLKLTINRDDVWALGRKIQNQPAGTASPSEIDLGDLPSGQPIWIVCRCESTDTLPLDITLDSESIAPGIPAQSMVDVDGGVRELFGAQRITRLEYAANPALDHWARRHRASERSVSEIRQQLIDESLSYGLICSETAFVGVREEAGQLVQRGAIIPNAVPAGWAFSVARRSIDFSEAHQSGDVTYNVAPAMIESEPRYSYSDVFQGLRQRRDTELVIFDGQPQFDDTIALLYEVDRLNQADHIHQLKLTLHEEAPDFDAELRIFLRNKTLPNARMRISDVVAMGGVRPLNLSVGSNELVRIELRQLTPDQEAPAMTITLGLTGY
jgi:Ca-activated chloride channel homolog